MSRIFNSAILFVLAIIYTLGLATVSLIKIESDGLSSVSFLHADKVFHFCVYVGLTLFWHFYYFRRREVTDYKANLWICLGAILFGMLIEVLQKELTTYRGFEVLDMLANSLGVLLAFMLLRSFGPKIQALYA